MRSRTKLATAALAAIAATLASATPAFAAGEPAAGAAMDQVLIATLGISFVTVAMLWLGLSHRSGRSDLLSRAATRASQISGLPTWVALPSGLVGLSLTTALLGMYWDISLHIDVGRDAGPLANPAHYLILIGLYGILAGGFFSIALSEGRPTRTAIRIREDWYAPLGALMIVGCASFALIGFPLDDVWHRLFGQDVTLWGPTHLMLIGGASLSLVGLAVLLTEGSRAQPAATGHATDRSRMLFLRRASLSGGLLLGLSTFQAEFDFGVPQFNFLFQPLLITLAASLGLVMARLWGGRGMALAAVAFFLLMRGTVTLIVGPVFGETMPHFPLYIVAALLVEGAAMVLGTRKPLAFGVVAGGAIGTIGFAAEWAWSHVWMPLPWPETLLPEAAVVALVAGLAGGAIGTLVGMALQIEPGQVPRSARIALPLAALAIVMSIGYCLNTPSRSDVRATIALHDVERGNKRAVAATIRVTPSEAADDARWLTATAWQGGGLVVDRLMRVREGVYRTTQPIPVHGDWKALLRFQTGSSLLALPIYLPEDRAIPAAGVAALPHMSRAFVDDATIMQREAKEGATSLTVLAYGVVLAITLSLLGGLAWGLARLASDGRPQLARTRRRRAPRNTTWATRSGV